MAKIQMSDRYAFDDEAKVRFTADGYMVAMPRVARTGIQLYYGGELGLTGKDASKVVRVFRPESEVFNTDSMKTFAYKPITDDHPPVAVNADNWGKYGKGQVGDEVARDGSAIRVPMVLMDGGLIKKYKDGKAELSVGYGCDINWTPGTDPATGQQYDCAQANIDVNHVAVVDAARAGKEFRIGDGSGALIDFKVYADAVAAISSGNINKSDALADGNGHLAKDSKGTPAYSIMKDGTIYLDSLRAMKTKAIAANDGDALAALDNLLLRIEPSPTAPVIIDAGHKETKQMKTLVVDGITVEVGDGNASEVIQKHIKTLGDSVSAMTIAATTAAATHDAAVKAKDAEIAKLSTDNATHVAKIATLEQQVKDAALTPDKLDKLVADRAVVGKKAKAILDTVVLDGKSDAEIMKQVVDAKLGEVAKAWTADQIATSFATLTASVDVTKIAAGDTSFNPAHHRPNGGVNDLRTVVADGGGSQRQAADAAADKRDARVRDAWKHPNGVPAAH